MNGKQWWMSAAVAVLGTLAIGTPAWSEDLDEDSFRAWGGTWMSDCGNNNSAKVTVFETALVFLNGSNRVAGSNFRAAAAYLGPEPPKNYVTALLSELPGELQFLAIVYKDAQGEYIMLDGDPKVLEQIGKAASTLKYRRCDPAAAKKAAAAAAPAAPASNPLPDAVGMIADPAFKAAYYKALGPYVKQPWLAKLDGPTPSSRKVTVAGTNYLLVSSCKNHDCADNNTVLLYSAAKKLVYGAIHVGGKSALIGNPPPAVAKELAVLWRKEWRSNQ